MEDCLLATRRFLNGNDRFEEIGAALKSPFDERNWNSFNKFVDEQLGQLGSIKNKQAKKHFSFTPVMMSIASKPPQIIGGAAGYIAGSVATKSFLVLPQGLYARCMLTATLSGVILMFAPSASLGVMFIAPTITAHFLETCGGLTLAYITGTSLKLAGKLSGYLVGKSLDLTIELLYKLCETLAGLMPKLHSEPKLSGICLLDGQHFINGEAVEIVAADDLSEKLAADERKPVTMEFTDREIILIVNGRTVTYNLNNSNSNHNTNEGVPSNNNESKSPTSQLSLSLEDLQILCKSPPQVRVSGELSFGDEDGASHSLK